jgi:hypothetical protein
MIYGVKKKERVGFIFASCKRFQKRLKPKHLRILRGTQNTHKIWA